MSYWLKLNTASTDKINAAAINDGVPIEHTYHAQKVLLPGIGWTSLAPKLPLRTTPLRAARIVSAKHLKSKIIPNNLREALKLSYLDRITWLQAYHEEYEGLKQLNTFTEIRKEKLHE